MIHWYSQNDPDDRNEDALGLDQAEHQDDDEEVEEQEDLVVVMITHGAGSNALIGAITEQPVLLDVGMASLTMAVKRDDAPPLESSDYIGSPTGSTPAQSPGSEMSANDFLQRRGSFNTGLSAMYEMKIIASTEHLRPGSDPSKALPLPFSARSGLSSGDSTSRNSNSASVMGSWNFNDDHERRKTQSTALGSIRRPGNANSAAPHPSLSGGMHRRATQPNTGTDHESLPALSGASTPASGGLWTPPAGRTPLLDAQRVAEDKKTLFSSLNSKQDGNSTSGDDLVLDFSNSPPDSRPGSAGGLRSKSRPQVGALDLPSISISNDNDYNNDTEDPQSPHTQPLVSTPSHNDAAGAPLSLIPSADAAGAPLAPIPSAESERDVVPELPSKRSNYAPPVVASIPDSLSRKLSQKGLWGTKPSGDEVKRNWPKVGKMKRRWTVSDQDGNG